MAIGVFDSGLGGLTVLAALRAAMPNQGFVFFGDNANAPYGDRSAEAVADLTREGVERLMRAGCALTVLACNTASALALRQLQRGWLPTRAPEARILGVFAPMIEAITAQDWVADDADAQTQPRRSAPPRRRALVFATPATAASGAFEREAERLAPGLAVACVACPGLVAAIEANDRAAAAEAIARAVAAAPAIPAAELGDTAIVLGCTHFPIVEDLFRAALPVGVEILSQPSVTAASLARYLARHPRFEDRAGGLTCLTSGDPARVSAQAAAYFGRSLRFERA